MSCAFTLFSLSRIRLKANMFSVDGMPKGIKVLHHTANAKKNIFAVTLNIFFVHICRSLFPYFLPKTVHVLVMSTPNHKSDFCSNIINKCVL